MRPFPRLSLRASFVGLVLAAVAVNAVALAGRQAPAAPAATKGERFAGGEWAQGETLYRANCARCHGPNLAGKCMSPSLLGVTRRMTDSAIVAHARKIGETMCCARHLRAVTDREFADIVAYFHAVDKDPAVRRRAERAGAGSGCCCCSP
jgi:mono/diheme cytochrome c family protein